MKIIALLTCVLVLSACAGSAASEEPERPAPSPVTTTVKDPSLLPLINEVALDPCPPGDPDALIAVPGLPSVTYRCLGHGPDVNLATLRGMPMVVNVWASWCPPCIAEMPVLTSAAADLRGRVQFLGIDIQDRDESALQMLRDFGADFPSVVDSAGEVRGLLSVPGPPVTFFVTERGEIVGRHDGAIVSTDYFNFLLKKYLDVDR